MSEPPVVGAVFTALSDPTRREVVRRLAGEEAGLVSATTQGRRRRYRLTPGPLTDAMGWMADVGAEWDERLAALRSHLIEGSA